MENESHFYSVSFLFAWEDESEVENMHHRVSLASVVLEAFYFYLRCLHSYIPWYCVVEDELVHVIQSVKQSHCFP